MEMELLRDSVPMVSLAAAAAALYARVASSLLRPGLPRLLALLPLFPFLAAAPLAFTSSAIARGTAAFFLAWLCAFKLALLAAGRGPLDPALPVLPFLFTALLPVKLRRAGIAGASKGSPPPSLASCAAKVAVIAAILRVYQYNARLHLYARRALYGVHIYCFLDLFFPCIAAAAGALGMETEPQFDRPYLASSLRDFWGRRWNLMVSAILRPSVYDPVRARAGNPAGVLATFLVSGLMHEGMVYYLSLRRPDGRMTAFFLLHGVCCVAEGWCARRWAARVLPPPPPRAVATVLVVVFVAGTSFGSSSRRCARMGWRRSCWMKVFQRGSATSSDHSSSVVVPAGARRAYEEDDCHGAEKQQQQRYRRREKKAASASSGPPAAAPACAAPASMEISGRLAGILSWRTMRGACAGPRESRFSPGQSGSGSVFLVGD